MIKSPSKFNNLTIKQAKFVKEYIKSNGNGQNSVMEVYDTKDFNTARSIASENLTKPNVRQCIIDSLKKRGFTEEKFGTILNKKLKQDDKPNHPRYMDMYIDITGARAPIKVDNTHSVKQDAEILNKYRPSDEEINSLDADKLT